MKRFLAAIAIALCLSFATWACGPDFPDTFFVTGSRYVSSLPQPSFASECGVILGWDKDSTQEQAEFPTRPELLQHTQEVDLAEFAQAVQGQPDAETLVNEYRAVRSTLSAYVSAWLEKVDAARWDYPRKEPEHPAPFDLTPHEPLLAKLSPEFALYLRGAVAYHNFDKENAAKNFAAVLELPAEQRVYRGVWAAFMLGKCVLEKEPLQAMAHFERCSSLAAEGGRDPLGLAADSVGWQARAELRAGLFITAIHRYVEEGKKPKNREWVALSLDTAVARALAAEPMEPALSRDALCRQLVSAWLISRGELGKEAQKWLAAVQQMEPQGVFPSADRLAWLTYSAGDMTAAAQWLSLSDPASPHAMMVRAKLLLRDGKFAEGQALLAQVTNPTPAALGWQQVGESYSNGGYHQQDDIGFASIKMGDYAGALRNFLLAGNWSDAAFVAERILSVDELASFVQTNLEDTALAYTLARRLARAGQWEQAHRWYPDDMSKVMPEWREPTLTEPPGAIAVRYAELMAKAEKAEGREKAEHLFKAAQILRDFGMELMGTELGPDWLLYWGDFNLSGEDGEMSANSKLAENIGTPDFAARLRANTTEPNKRFHYRYRAADLMWQCAAALPNNDTLSAHALYLGGLWLSKRDPGAADKFYKALVRRNPNLLIAQQANTLRWFPQEFTDTVTYQSLSKPWYRVKRNLAVIGLTAMAVSLVLVGLLLRRRQRK